MNEPLRDASGGVEDTSTRHRILVATAEVLGRSGQTKLSLSEVALQAGVSRPTLYRWFAQYPGLAVKVGGRYYVDPDAWAAFLAGRPVARAS